MGLIYIGLPVVPMLADFGVNVIFADHIKQERDNLKGKIILDCHGISPLDGVYHI